MNWSEEFEGKLLTALFAKGAGTACARCAGMNFVVLPGFFVKFAFLSLPPDATQGHTTLPTIVTKCEQCGSLNEHDLGALGIPMPAPVEKGVAA